MVKSPFCGAARLEPAPARAGDLRSLAPSTLPPAAKGGCPLGGAGVARLRCPQNKKRSLGPRT